MKFQTSLRPTYASGEQKIEANVPEMKNDMMEEKKKKMAGKNEKSATDKSHKLDHESAYETKMT